MSQAPLNIKLRCTSWQQLANIHRRDLSRHAIFLKSATPPPVGTNVRIDLSLPTGSGVVLSGTVAEHVAEGGLGGRGPGIDIKLYAIPQSALWLIETALASAHSTPERALAPTPTAPREASDGESRDLVVAEDELLAALMTELESLRKFNPFQILGVGYDATDEAVRAAFAALTKRYHPDRFTRYTSSSLHTLASEIFILIRDAYGRLSDETVRAKTLASLGVRAKVRVPRPENNDASSGDRPAVSAPARAHSPPRSTSAPVASRRPTGAPRPATGASDAAGPIATTGAVNDGRSDLRRADSLVDAGQYDEAILLYGRFVRRPATDRSARAGIELAEGLKALGQRDRLEAAQRFEAVLEIDPTNERAARELAEMRRLATNERKGLLSRLMEKKD